MKKAAIIGCGMIANSAHIPAYKHLQDDFEVVGVCDINEASARDTAERHGIPYYTTDAEKMLCDLKPDIVSVCVPNMFHRQYAELALKSGADVLCEKPLAVNLADAKALFDLANKTGRTLCACQSMRYTPDRMYAKKLLGENLCGNIYYGDFSRIRRRGIPKWGGFHMQSVSGGGAFVDIGVHMLDALVWLMGNPRAVAVSGTAGAYIAKTDADTSGISKASGVLTGKLHSQRVYSDDEFDVEDFASGNIKFENGASVNFKVAWAANLPDETSITLCGNKAGLSLPSLTLFEGDGEADGGNGRTLTSHFENPYPNEPFCGHFMLLDDLAKYYKGEGEIPVKPEETINVAAITDMFYTAVKLGREVKRNELE